MLLRRVVFYAQFALAIVLPIWVIASQSIRSGGLGWDFLAFLAVSGLLFFSLGVIAVLIGARKSVRSAKAVSWVDAGLLLAAWVSILVFGVVAETLILTLAFVLLVALFWVAVWELVTETRQRVKGFVDDLALTADKSRARTPGDAGRIVVVPPPAVDSDTDSAERSR